MGAARDSCEEIQGVAVATPESRWRHTRPGRSSPNEADKDAEELEALEGHKLETKNNIRRMAESICGNTGGTTPSEYDLGTA